jgi:hypothetical protein
MSELVIPHRFIDRRLSKAEMARQFLKDSIKTMEFQLEQARSDKNQKDVEAISYILEKMWLMLSD